VKLWRRSNARREQQRADKIRERERALELLDELQRLSAQTQERDTPRSYPQKRKREVT
jgi:hypothetical protein